MKFSDLDLKPRPHGFGGVRATVFFPNGYGASVIQGPGSYGYESGLYELGVLSGDEKDSQLCYDTPITEDVEGNLSETEVTALLERIEALPQRVVALPATV